MLKNPKREAPWKTSFAESYHKNSKTLQPSTQQQGENKRSRLTSLAGGVGLSPDAPAVGAPAIPAAGASAAA